MIDLWFWLCVVFFWIGCAITGLLLAERRGQPKWLGFACGLVFGPVGLSWVWASIDDPMSIQESLIARRQAKRCPECGSTCDPRAKICHACRSEFSAKPDYRSTGVTL